MATAVPSKNAVMIKEGCLRSALSASCALRVVRRPVIREGQRLKDGGIACVLPTQACRELGAELVIGSDVWEMSSLLRFVGCQPRHPFGERLYPAHYRSASSYADVVIPVDVPLSGYLPGAAAAQRMIDAGEAAASRGPGGECLTPAGPQPFQSELFA